MILWQPSTGQIGGEPESSNNTSTYKETLETMKTFRLLSSMGTLSLPTETMFAEAKEIFTLVRTFVDDTSETYVDGRAVAQIGKRGDSAYDIWEGSRDFDGCARIVPRCRGMRDKETR